MRRVKRVWYAFLRTLAVDETKLDIDFELEEPEPEEEEVLGPWHPKTIEMIETIWGKGFNMPGGAQHALTLAKPFALDNQMNLLDLTSGMGGGTIAVTSQFGCYATLLENVPELSEISKRNIDMSDTRSKIKLQDYDPAEITLKANSFDCILTREFLFRTEDKTRILRVLKRALRMYGQLSLTDFMLPPGKEPSAAVNKWIKNDPFPIHLWSLDRYETEIAALELDVRVSEDISKDYYGYMTRAFQSFIDRYQDGRIKATPGQLEILMKEVERWARLAALLEAGDLRLYRYFALKPVKA
ncbi:methyltransferase domain-containing protein [Nisaea sp.]|uniref:methyltransferase domain-containing protein n=1 Tax=Nisaea sp. TaxID=2024842 RepID=UPI0032EDDF92